MTENLKTRIAGIEGYQKGLDQIISLRFHHFYRLILTTTAAIGICSSIFSA